MRMFQVFPNALRKSIDILQGALHLTLGHSASRLGIRSLPEGGREGA